jgi:predicted ATPase/class 3 adenylate cyclase
MDPVPAISEPLPAVASLFTDVEGSTRLWEVEPQRMPMAMALHDALAREAVAHGGGAVVKMIGDGVHAAFDDPLGALAAALHLQLALRDAAATNGIALHVRCGVHVGPAERRDNDWFGTSVNRAARIMSAAHGGQVLLSQAAVDAIGARLPDRVALRDLGRVRLRDLARPERIHQVLHEQLRQDFPPLRSLEATPNNLPQQMTSFVGRESGLAEVKSLLSRTGLLTLFGMGGLGKTRLSLQVAADVLDDYADGVWFVELAPLADARLVPQAVASVLGVMEDAGRPVIEALTRFVRDRQLLLILDNCEHLLDACAALARALLQAGAQVKVLASSREHLHVPGETMYAVAPLALPVADGHAGVEALLAYESVRLFVDRAQAVQPAFRLTPQNAAALTDICRRLDGIPLALELAAARVSALSVERIAERLSDRFHLLSRGSRTALPRQQTLRALIDWSHDLLDANEQAMFARLAVFAGGFAMEAAEVVGAGGRIAPQAVLGLLTALVDKSLVSIDPSGERYRLLETVRQYAQERLDTAEDSDAVRTRHLDWLVGYVEGVRPRLWGPHQGRWLARLDQERENLLAAHAWCEHAEGGGDRDLRLVFAAQLYWLPRGLLELGYRVTTEALARPDAQAPRTHRSGALYAASQLAYFRGDYAATRRHAEECLAIARALSLDDRAAATLLLLGYAGDALGDRELARSSFEASADLARTLHDDERLSFALNALAGHHAETGDLARAEALFEESVALSRVLGDQDSLGIVLPNLARLVVERGNAPRAAALLRESVTIAGAIGSTRSGQNSIEVAAGLAVLTGEWRQAARFYGAVEAYMTQMAMRRTPADDAFLAAQIATARTALGRADFEAAEAAGRTLSYEAALESVRLWLGD